MRAPVGIQAVEQHGEFSRESILLSGKQFQIFYMKQTGCIMKHDAKSE